MPKPSPELQLDAEGLSGQRVFRLAAVGVHIDAGKALAEEIVGDDVSCGVDRRRAPCGSKREPSGPSRCPGRACIARARACRRLWRGKQRRRRNHRRRCGRRSPDPSSRSRGRSSCGICRMAATPVCTKCDFCVPLQQVAWPSLKSTSAHAGPMEACDWKGHSYSASITRAAFLKASSTSPACLPATSRLRTGALRM